MPPPLLSIFRPIGYRGSEKGTKARNLRSTLYRSKTWTGFRARAGLFRQDHHIGAGPAVDKRSTGKSPRAGQGKISKVKTLGQKQSPGWASGLRQLYDSVAHEPLPDSLKDLLSKLDSKS